MSKTGAIFLGVIFVYLVVEFVCWFISPVRKPSRQTCPRNLPKIRSDEAMLEVCYDGRSFSPFPLLNYMDLPLTLRSANGARERRAIRLTNRYSTNPLRLTNNTAQGLCRPTVRSRRPVGFSGTPPTTHAPVGVSSRLLQASASPAGLPVRVDSQGAIGWSPGNRVGANSTHSAGDAGKELVLEKSRRR